MAPRRVQSIPSLVRHRATLAAVVGLSGLATSACVGGGDSEPPVLQPGAVLTVQSDEQLATAEVDPLAETPFTQGLHTFFVRITPTDVGASATLADPPLSIFMPAHGHSTSQPNIVDADDGFRIEELNLFMPGRWELTLNFQVDGSDDSATFSVDVR